jgi:hypothetical protein
MTPKSESGKKRELNTSTDEMVPLDPKLGKKVTNEVEVDLHPLHKMQTFPEKITQYTKSWEKKMEGQSELGDLLRCADRIKNRISEIDSEQLAPKLGCFIPIQTSYFLNFDAQFNAIIEDLQLDIFALPGEPERVFSLNKKTDAILSMNNSMESLLELYEGLNNPTYSESTLKLLIQNDVKILSDQELCKVEVNGFTNLYFAIKAYSLFDDLMQLIAEEIQEDVRRVLKILEYAKANFVLNDYQILQRLQKKLLLHLKLFYSYFHQFYQGLASAIETLQDSRLKKPLEDADVLKKSLLTLHEEIIPVTEDFAGNVGEAEADYNQQFKKVLDPFNSKQKRNTLSIGLVESASTYFAARMEDIKALKDNHTKSEMINFFEVIFRTLRHSHNNPS